MSGWSRRARSSSPSSAAQRERRRPRRVWPQSPRCGWRRTRGTGRRSRAGTAARGAARAARPRAPWARGRAGRREGERVVGRRPRLVQLPHADVERSAHGLQAPPAGPLPGRGDRPGHDDPVAQALQHEVGLDGRAVGHGRVDHLRPGGRADQVDLLLRGRPAEQLGHVDDERPPRSRSDLGRRTPSRCRPRAARPRPRGTPMFSRSRPACTVRISLSSTISKLPRRWSQKSSTSWRMRRASLSAPSTIWRARSSAARTTSWRCTMRSAWARAASRMSSASRRVLVRNSLRSFNSQPGLLQLVGQAVERLLEQLEDLVPVDHGRRRERDGAGRRDDVDGPAQQRLGVVDRVGVVTHRANRSFKRRATGAGTRALTSRPSRAISRM